MIWREAKPEVPLGMPADRNLFQKLVAAQLKMGRTPMNLGAALPCPFSAGTLNVDGASAFTRAVRAPFETEGRLWRSWFSSIHATKTRQARSAKMSSFKHPSFQDRAGQAAAAKEKALERFRARPEPDQEKLNQRKLAAERRQAAREEKAAAKKAAAEAAAQAKAEAAAKAAKPVPTEAERKAARDARYAARKARR